MSSERVFTSVSPAPYFPTPFAARWGILRGGDIPLATSIFGFFYTKENCAWHVALELTTTWD